MKLTKYQLKVLRAWLRYYHSGYGFDKWLGINWKLMIFLVVMLALALVIATAVPVVGWTCFAFYLGTLLRDITYFRLGRRNWPVMLDVVNWDRVQQLVDTHDKPAENK
jgi:hypothetical protein